VIWENLTYYTIVFVIGFFVGIEVSRHYNEKTRKYSLGKIIQGVMISKSVNELQEYSSQLDLLLHKIIVSSDNLATQLRRGEDIEEIFYEPNGLENGNDGFTSLDDRDKKTAT